MQPRSYRQNIAGTQSRQKNKKETQTKKRPCRRKSQMAAIRPNNRRYKGLEGYTALLAADEIAWFAEISVHRKRSKERPDVFGIRKRENRFQQLSVYKNNL